MLFEDDVLAHATMTFGHEEHVAILTVRFTPHEGVVEYVGDFSAGERRRNVQCSDLLRNVENAASVATTALARSGEIETVLPEHGVHACYLIRATCSQWAKSSAPEGIYGPMQPSRQGLHPTRSAAPSRYRA